MATMKYGIIGAGQYGSAIARELAAKGAEVYSFDLNHERVEAIKDEVAFAVSLDSTDKKVLEAQNISSFDAVVVAIGENFEATILTALNLLDMNIPRVIVRASGENQVRILKNIGVQEILTPEKEVAENIAEMLINPSITAFLQLPDNYEIAEIKAPKGVANRTIHDVDLRNKYTLTLITLKRAYEVKGEADETVIEEHTIGVPKGDTVIYDTDTLVVFGTLKNIKRFIEING
ncbi:MAG: TrkA family potassium uptake protein [Flavobacteriales bacterium]|nr:TrkA family potassium uptake protein [Flavobacteriales bacterium]